MTNKELYGRIAKGPYIIKRLLKHGFIDHIGYVEIKQGRAFIENSKGFVSEIDPDLDLSDPRDKDHPTKYHPSELERCRNIESFIDRCERLARFHRSMLR